MIRGKRLVVGLVAAVGLTCSACTFDGVNSVPLPGNTAGGDVFTVTVDFADAQNLVGNSPVKSGNVTVGSIRRIETDGWHAKATLEVNSNTDIPANVEARLAQTGLFGSQYVELELPEGRKPLGRLGNGAHLGLNRTSGYPAVEEVLSSLSLVLNGSGLAQVRTISFEVDRILDGRTGKAHDLLGRLDIAVSSLADQRHEIGEALDSMRRLSGELNRQKSVIGRGIDSLTPAIALVNQQENQLIDALGKLGDFGDAATRVLNSSHDDLVTNLHSLAPTLNRLADSGKNLSESLKIALTMPFPVTTTDRGIRGDYLNLFLTLDVSPQKLGEAVLPSIVTRGQRKQPSLARSKADPLRAPLAAGRRDNR